MAIRSRVLVFVLFLAVMPASKAFANCQDPQLQKFLQMDYQAFDQSPPSGGWRVLENQGRNQEIAEIIEGYARCRSGLASDQKATLYFHAGQIFADLGKYDLAVKRMKRAYDRKLDRKYHWNSYVAGTIAFIQKDLKELQAARDRVLKAEPDHPYVETLNDLIRCFNRPYKKFESCRNEKVKSAPESQPSVK